MRFPSKLFPEENHVSAFNDGGALWESYLSETWWIHNRLKSNQQMLLEDNSPSRERLTAEVAGNLIATVGLLGYCLWSALGHLEAILVNDEIVGVVASTNLLAIIAMAECLKDI